MKTKLIILSMLFGGAISMHYSYAPKGRYTVKSTAVSAKLPTGQAQVKLEFKFSAGCKEGNVKVTVDGTGTPRIVTAKTPRTNIMVKKGKHIFQMYSSICDTVITQPIDLKDKTSTTIEVEF